MLPVTTATINEVMSDRCHEQHLFPLVKGYIDAYLCICKHFQNYPLYREPLEQTQPFDEFVYLSRYPMIQYNSDRMSLKLSDTKLCIKIMCHTW